MLGKLKLKLADESGAVTVDWVVLTASIVAINVVVMIGWFQGAMEEAGEHVGSQAAKAVDGVDE
ncbi:hypothetical protein [Halovulum sp. GXIMD14793]